MVDPTKLRKFDRNLLDSCGHLEERVIEEVPPCWFCPSTTGKQTKEHLFPQWLLRHYNAMDEQVQPFRFSLPLMQIASQRPQMPLMAAVSGEVCAACNNGWMCTLEANTKPILSSIPTSGEISEADALTLARWFTKTAVALNVSMPYRLQFERWQRHALKTGMPEGAYVGLFRVTKQNGTIDWVQNTVLSCDVPTSTSESDVKKFLARAYYAQIRVADLVGMVALRPPSPSLIGDGEFLTDIPLIWPPREPLTWEDLPIFEDYRDGFKHWSFLPDQEASDGSQPMVRPPSGTSHDAAHP